MGLWAWIKTLVKSRKALSEAQNVAKNLGQIKRGYKTLGFWVTFTGSIAAFGASLQGLLPPAVALAIVTGSAGIYNILRGLKKRADENVDRSVYRSTETWVGVAAILEGVFLSWHQGGILPQITGPAVAVLSGVMVVARDWANQDPKTDPAKPK